MTAHNYYRLHPDIQDAVDTTIAMTFDNVRLAQRKTKAIPQAIITIFYLVEAANKVRMHTPGNRHYYQKKFCEIPKHQHKRP